MSDNELPRWVTIKQAATYDQCSPRTVRRRIASGELKAKRVGKRLIRIDRDSLLGQRPVGVTTR